MSASKLSKNSTIKTKNLTTKTTSHCGVIVGFFYFYLDDLSECMEAGRQGKGRASHHWMLINLCIDNLILFT